MIERLITVECHLPLVDWTIRKSVKVEVKVDALMRTDCDGFIQEGVGGRRDALAQAPRRSSFFLSASFRRTRTHTRAVSLTDLFELIEIYSRY